jgi:hypothetical protein
VFRVDDRIAPHWSADFVEHLRTVHFSLVAVCIALIGLTQFEKPKDIVTAQAQFQQIKKLVDNWVQVPATFANALSAEGVITMSGPGTPEVTSVLGKNVSFGLTGIIWFPSLKKGEGEAVSGDNFYQKISPAPQSLAEFRDFWDSYNGKIPVWSVDNRSLEHKYAIETGGGSWSAAPYIFGHFSYSESIGATLSDDQEKKVIADTLGVRSADCVYSVTSGADRMLLPAPCTRKEFDVQAELIKGNTSWKPGTFSTSFLELDSEVSWKGDTSFEFIASHLADEAGKPKADSFEVFGVKFPIESAMRWGIVLILGIQLYLWIHLFELSPKLKKGDPGWDVAWIGVYQSFPAKAVFFVSTAFLPVLTIAILGRHAFQSVGHQDVHKSAGVWLIYSSAVLASLTLSVLIAKGIPGEREEERKLPMQAPRSHGSPSPAVAAGIVIGMLAMVIIPAAIALHSVRFPSQLVATNPNPSPYGYTSSLLLFVVPIVVIGFWFLPSEGLNIPHRAFWRTIAILVPFGWLLDVVCAQWFFYFPNREATLGLLAPALGKGVPIEEYLFYLTGFLTILLLYVWLSEYWLAAYTVPDYRSEANLTGRLLQFHPTSLIVGLVLIGCAIAYKKWFAVPHDGWPWYFCVLVIGGLVPAVGFFPVARRLINWRALSMTIFFVLLVSMLWEATLALPYGWWKYQHRQMVGIFVGAWSGLPIEAVLVWLAVSYGTVILFETVKVWQASGRPAKEAFLGLPSATPSPGGKGNQEHKTGA